MTNASLNLPVNFLKKILIEALLARQNINLKLPEDILSIGRLNIDEILKILEDFKLQGDDTLDFHVYNLLCEDLENDLNGVLAELPLFLELRLPE